MQDKQKVTLYLPQRLHRQLKIRSAVESEPMSSMVERALAFYLEHSEVVEQYSESHGQTHRVYSCPACESPAVLRDGELVSLGSSASILEDDSLSIERAASLHRSANASSTDETSDPEALVPC